jgi:hypothetical protein
MSSKVKTFVEMAVDYGIGHLGTSMARSTPDVLRVDLRRRFRAHLSIHGGMERRIRELGFG